MEQHLKTRLGELKSEFESGKKMLVEHEAKQTKLRESLLRISGAIQVLEEELKILGDGARQDNIETLEVNKIEASG